ncbi:MAG TPA: cupin domain-containing protein [Terracidiphilus sp.]|nr:cupin domain-containing protein [Terracidiphilus sp.]
MRHLSRIAALCTAAWLAGFLSGIAPACAQSPVGNPLARPRVFAYSRMTPKTAPNGAVSRGVFAGTLATGEAVGAHETMQPAGARPVPLHRIRHSEIIVVRQGTVAFEHDGLSERAGPGDIVYVAYGTLHRIRNVGEGPARYVVIQIGGDTRR